MEQKRPIAHLGLRMDRTLHDKLYYMCSSLALVYHKKRF